ncbi:MAG TPA: prolipoprotein diacylglyceryl transferase, partial [Euzebyales bacterium]|nr:prolipoprotein diacylglyceryl transferase [Euzebyales bacterium]
MMLAVIPPPPGQLIELGPLSIHYYGVLIGIGALLAIALGRRRWAALGGDPDLVDRVGFVSVMAGLAGGRAGYVITHSGAFVDRPWAVLFLWEGGLALFGGLTLGFAVGVWYARRLGMPLWPALDAIVPGIPLAQAIGRWGNYFNQELYGTPTTLPWALEVEPARRVPEYAAFETFHPTFLYESVLNLLLVAVLVFVVGRSRMRQGSILWVYLAGYGLIRFAVELLRTDTTFRLLGLSRNNWIAGLVFVAGVIVLRWWQTHGPDRVVGTPIDQPADGSDSAVDGSGAAVDGSGGAVASADDGGMDARGVAGDDVTAGNAGDGTASAPTDDRDASASSADAGDSGASADELSDDEREASDDEREASSAPSQP